MTSLVRLFAGIEGGGTKTSLTIIDQNGNLLIESFTGPSNPWYLKNESNQNGFEIAATLLNDLIQNSVKRMLETGLITENEYILEAASCCLSGGGSVVAQEQLYKEFKKLNINYKIFITNDSIASVFTAFKNGGIVLISGTGSNCVLANPVNTKIDSFNQIECYSAGGWGYLLGDEGSGFWISKELIKYIINVNDNFITLLEDEEINEYNELKKLVYEHFQIKSFRDILPYFYADRKSDKIASLTEKLAKTKSKKILLEIFEDAGFKLAKHILALRAKLNQKLIDENNGLPIVCTGSVFKSWSLLKTGFLKGLQNQHINFKKIKKFCLVRINNNSAIGASLLAARFCSIDLNFDLSRNTSVLDVIEIE